MPSRTTDFTCHPDGQFTFVRSVEQAGHGIYRCGCGREVLKSAWDVRSGRNRSCGCVRTAFLKSGRMKKATKHGKWGTPEYKAWVKLRMRCGDLTDRQYADYGGRGIDVCVRWQNDFAAFLAGMGERPSPKHSVDRVDNGKGYWCGHSDCADCGPVGREPNCRWATAVQQQRNTRLNRNIAHAGKTQCLAAWAAELGITPQALRRRIRVWGVGRAMTIEKVPRTGPRPIKSFV